MKRIIVAIVLACAATAAWAACSTSTILIDGRLITCTTCCFGGHCTTNCF